MGRGLVRFGTEKSVGRVVFHPSQCFFRRGKVRYGQLGLGAVRFGTVRFGTVRRGPVWLGLRNQRIGQRAAPSSDF